MIIDLMPNRNFMKVLLSCVIGLIIFIGLFTFFMIFVYNTILSKMVFISLTLLIAWSLVAIRKNFIGKPSHLDIEEKTLFTVEKGFFTFEYKECHFASIESLTLNVHNSGTKRGIFYQVLVALDHKEVELGAYDIKNNALLIVEKLSKHFNMTVHYTATNYLFETIDKPLLNPQYRFSSMPPAYLINGLLVGLPPLCITWINKLYFISAIIICIMGYCFYLYYQAKRNLKEISNTIES
jgi:hypothetical protein